MNSQFRKMNLLVALLALTGILMTTACGPAYAPRVAPDQEPRLSRHFINYLYMKWGGDPMVVDFAREGMPYRDLTDRVRSCFDLRSCRFVLDQIGESMLDSRYETGSLDQMRHLNGKVLAFVHHATEAYRSDYETGAARLGDKNFLDTLADPNNCDGVRTAFANTDTAHRTFDANHDLYRDRFDGLGDEFVGRFHESIERIRDVSFTLSARCYVLARHPAFAEHMPSSLEAYRQPGTDYVHLTDNPDNGIKLPSRAPSVCTKEDPDGDGIPNDSAE